MVGMSEVMYLVKSAFALQMKLLSNSSFSEMRKSNAIGHCTNRSVYPWSLCYSTVL